MHSFSLIGACGYIAPRHMQAIYDTKNILVSAYDPMDSLGILDRYSYDVQFFKTYEEFAFFNSCVSPKKIDFVSVCSPNHLHKPHIAASLREGSSVICEKPLVLTTRDIDDLRKLEKQTGKKVFTVLQLRVHDAIKALKKKISESSSNEKFEVDLCYMTSRGPWYHQTWKANEMLSGGLPSNIGIHFFDMLTWVFGGIQKNELHLAEPDIYGGYLELERARVRWVLSINRSYLPKKAQREDLTTFRSITVDGEEIEFSGGFTDLHTRVYEDILSGQGYGLDDSEEAIKIAEQIRNMNPSGICGHSHTVLKSL